MYIIKRTNNTTTDYWHRRNWGGKEGAKQITLAEARRKLNALNAKDKQYQWVYEIEACEKSALEKKFGKKKLQEMAAALVADALKPNASLQARVALLNLVNFKKKRKSAT